MINSSFFFIYNAHGSRLTGAASPITESAGGVISELPKAQKIKSAREIQKLINSN